MSVGRICSRVVATASESETIRTAAERMDELEVGTLVVLGSENPRRPVGIVTDRDVAVRCITGRFSADVAVSRIMSTPVHTVDDQAPVEDAVDMMARTVSRRLVVTGEDGSLVGLLSLDDVLEVIGES